MTLNDLAFHAATFGGCGSFKKIAELGYDSEEQFLEETERQKKAKWSYYDDGRKVMTIDKTNGESGWDCKFIVKDGWVATLNYGLLELQMQERKNKKANIADNNYDHYDDDDSLYYDDDVPTEDYGHDDYNDDYGWWR